jgi:hypothetical protein
MPIASIRLHIYPARDEPSVSRSNVFKLQVDKLMLESQRFFGPEEDSIPCHGIGVMMCQLSGFVQVIL